jgi:hypothetical protein
MANSHIGTGNRSSKGKNMKKRKQRSGIGIAVKAVLITTLALYLPLTAYSQPASGWTAVTKSPFNDTITDSINTIAYGNGRFVAGGRIGNSVKMAYSSDGITWTAVPNNPLVCEGLPTIHTIVYGNGKFVAVRSQANKGNGKIAYSSDGITWTALDDPLNGITAIAYGNGRFVAVGNGRKIAYSSDGASWAVTADLTFNSILGDGIIDEIAYGNNKFVAAGTVPILPLIPGQNRGVKVTTSTDGESWIPGTDIVINNKSTSGTLAGRINLITFGNGKFVASAINKIYTSTDGINWTDVTWTDSTFGNAFWDSRIIAIAYGNNKFVALGEDKIIAYSSDGVKWTEEKNSTLWTALKGTYATGSPRAIAYGNGRFVAAGDGGKMAYLLDN